MRFLPVLFLIVFTSICFGADESQKSQITVTCALFGSGTNGVDVTDRVTELLRTEVDGFSARGDWLKADPLPYKPKALAITYDYKGRHCLFVVASTQKVSLDLLIANANLPKKVAPLRVL